MRVVFWGSPEFALPTLRALGDEGHMVAGVVTRPDRPSGRGRKPRPCAVKAWAEREELRILTPDRPRGDEFLAELRALEPDISVVVAYGHILPPEVLELPPHGSINAHASLLPEFRGAAPIARAMADGETVTGVTVMRMVDELDAGPVLLQGELPIDPQENATELTARLAELAAGLIVEALALLEIGAIEEWEQDHEHATYAHKLDRGEARVNWAATATPVANHIRAMDSPPGAWSELDGVPVKLFRPEPLPYQSHAEAPGTVLAADDENGLLVATAQGAVRLGEVQEAGRKRIATRDWLRGREIPVGARFI